MRKSQAGLFVVCTLVVLMAAQHAAAQSWDMRPYGGLSNSDFYGGSKMLGRESRNGLAFGVGAELIRHEDDPIGWEFGVSYVQKGAKGTIEVNPDDPHQPPDPDLNFQGDVKLAYLQLEFLAVGHLYTSKTTEVRLYLGPTLGNRLSARAEGTSDGKPVDVDLSDNVKLFEWGWILGEGFNYNLGGWSLIFDVSGIMGVNSIGEAQLEGDLKTRTLLATVGVSLPLTR